MTLAFQDFKTFRAGLLTISPLLSIKSYLAFSRQWRSSIRNLTMHRAFPKNHKCGTLSDFIHYGHSREYFYNSWTSFSLSLNRLVCLSVTSLHIVDRYMRDMRAVSSMVLETSALAPTISVIDGNGMAWVNQYEQWHLSWQWALCELAHHSASSPPDMGPAI